MATVKRVRIRNIMGIEEIEFEPGKVTRISGANASGKSSVLESLKAIVEGGHDATLLRKGEEEGEIVLVLDDAVEIRKRVTAEKSTLDVRHPEFGRISAPKTFVERLIDRTAFNPVRFLTADNRVELLLEAAGTKVDPDDLREAIDGIPEGEVRLPDLDDLAEGPALEAIERLYSEVYSARTGVNRVLRDKRTTAKELSESLPADGADPDEVEEELRSAEAKLEAERSEEREKIEAVRKETQADVQRIRALSEEAVAELRQKIEAEQERARAEMDERKGKGQAQVEEVSENYAEEIDRWVEAVGTLRERLRAVEDASRSRRLIEAAEKEAKWRRGQSTALTEALSKLDDLKVEALSSLPIEGASFEDGELYVDGVAFDRLNSAKKVELVMRIAEVRAGDLGLVVVDDLELLDDEHFEALTAALEASELQAIVTRVEQDGSPLSIESDGEAG